MSFDPFLKYSFVLLEASWPPAKAFKVIDDHGMSYTHFIFHLQDDDGHSKYYLRRKDKKIIKLLKATKSIQGISEILDMNDWQPDLVVDLFTPPQEVTQNQFIVIHEGAVNGFVSLYREDSEGIDFAGDLIGNNNSNETRGLDSHDREVITISNGSSKESSPPSSEAEPLIGSVKDTSFEAYPLMEVIGTVEPGEKVAVKVGFSEALDDTLEEVEKINILNPLSDANIEFTFTAIGAKVLNAQLSYELKLAMSSVQFLECEVNKDAKKVVFKVSYYYLKQAVGSATRAFELEEKQIADIPDPEEVAETHLGCPINLNEEHIHKRMVDVTLKLSQQEDELSWELSSLSPSYLHTFKVPIKKTLKPEAFAKKIGKHISLFDYKGDSTSNTLETIGEQISNLMPEAFFEHLKKVRKTLKRKLNLLFITDEPYIPWELALLPEPLEVEETYPSFLFCQVNMGRWWEGRTISTPPQVQIEVKLFTAVAAKYNLKSKQRELEKALEEREYLTETFEAKPLNASSKDLDPLRKGTPLPGHLIHLALHGISDPVTNEQRIILYDGTYLTPESLLGRYRCGETPYFSFFFLNACQVATPGESLGQISGFPGTLLSKGTMGFIAPLWNVDDEIAMEFSKAFYEKTLNEGKTVGEAMNSLRNEYQAGDNVTRLAYIYYGHPNLRLIRSNT